MRRYSIFPILIALLSTVSLKAQYDDVYYDPSRDARKTTRTESRNTPATTRNNDDNSASDYDDQYDQSEYYEYDDEYDDYQYSSRIRRFHRPVRGFSYYDLTYVDYYYYDPFYYDRMFARPSFNISFGNSYFNRYDRFNRWNNSLWYNRYWNNYCAFNSWDTWGMPSWGMNRFNSGYYDPYGYNNFNGFGNSYGSNGYYPYRNGHYTSNNYNNNGNNVGINANNPSRGRTYSPRSNSTLAEPVSPTGTVRNGRSEQTTNQRAESARLNNRGEKAGNTGGATSPREPGLVAPENGTRTNGRQKYSTESSDTRPTAAERPNRSRNEINTEGGEVTTPQRSELPTRQRRTESERPQVTQERPRYEERPNRTYEPRNTESERPARTERPSRETPRTETRQEAPRSQPRQERSESRQESPRYEAPRQETRSYSPPPQQSAPQRSESAPAPSRSNSRSGSRE
jgi:hypothetical protein